MLRLLALLLSTAVAVLAMWVGGGAANVGDHAVHPAFIYDAPASSTTPPVNARAGVFGGSDDSLQPPAGHLRGSRKVLAPKGADETADVGTDLAVRPKLKPSRHYLHERKMERQLRTADVFDAYKNPLAVGPVRYDPFGRPSTLFQGRNAQAAINPQTGEIVTAFPTGSRLRRQLLRRAGGSP